MQPRILVIGDLILDIYLHGSVERINPEAPGIVFKPERMEERLGGAGAVAMLCASLGSETTLVAPGTSPSPAEKLVEAVGIQWCPSRPASRLTAKQRLVSGGRLLHDRIDVDEVSTAPVDSHLPVGAPPVCAILIADYGRGAIGPDTLAAVRRLHPKVPIVVDPARGTDWKKYAGATIIKCNAAEAQGARAHTDLGISHLIVTDSGNGMTLDGNSIPTDSRPALDVTGAGDTVLAVLGVCLAQGIELENACRFANRAAGLQVGKLGVQPITWDEIAKAATKLPSDVYERPDLRPPTSGPSSAKLVTPAVAAEAAAKAREAGRKVIFTNGCFDLLHAGHVDLLQRARAMGDLLIVGLNSDASVRRLKGRSRPINAQSHRAAVLAALSCVDYLTIFDGEPDELLAAIRPDVLVKGDDYRGRPITGAGYARRVELVPLLYAKGDLSHERLSSTAMLSRLNSARYHDSILR